MVIPKFVWLCLGFLLWPYKENIYSGMCEDLQCFLYFVSCDWSAFIITAQSETPIELLIVMFVYNQLGKAAFQRHNDPLDAALFYLAMKKKAVLWGLFR